MCIQSWEKMVGDFGGKCAMQHNAIEATPDVISESNLISGG
jgi:hypothetical protein